MKKYIISILVASVFLLGTPFISPGLSAAELNIRDFVNLLVIIGVITPDKMPAVNDFLATLELPQRSGPPGRSGNICLDGSYVSGLVGCPSVSETTTESSITVIYPNDGEVISYGDIYMAGDLMFRWQSSQGENYKPSPNFKAYIIDENSSIIRDDIMNTISSIGGGVFVSSFIGETKIKTNTKYKIKICDYLDSREYCDTSDNYFIIK